MVRVGSTAGSAVRNELSAVETKCYSVGQIRLFLGFIASLFKATAT
jgi:hypothetical protein